MKYHSFIYTIRYTIYDLLKKKLQHCFKVEPSFKKNQCQENKKFDIYALRIEIFFPCSNRKA